MYHLRQLAARILSRSGSRPASQQADPEWHRRAVGGRWEQIGRLQLDFMVAQGLQPHHYLLDVGCGSLRGGVHFVRYLASGHYFGIDINQQLLDAGRLELTAAGLADRQVTLVQTDAFDFQSLGRQFDFALAQSLFTHLSLNSILHCLMNIEAVLAPGGQFFATFFENPLGKFSRAPILQARVEDWDGLTYFDRDPYHYDIATFEWLCSGTRLSVCYLGDWGHPCNQKMLCFTRTG